MRGHDCEQGEVGQLRRGSGVSVAQDGSRSWCLATAEFDGNGDQSASN